MNSDAQRSGGPRPATSAIHAGEPAAQPGGPVVAPVVRSSTFHSPPSAGAEAGEPLRYSRYGNNPNQESVAAKIAALEGTEAALALASGMAATAMTLLAVVEQGDHIVASRHLYGATGVLLADELPRRGIATTFVEPSEPAAWQAALRPRTRVLLIELPTNPTLKVFDIEPARRAADEACAILAADVTFATPINLRAAEHGVDAVIHSATKYLGGPLRPDRRRGGRQPRADRRGCPDDEAVRAVESIRRPPGCWSAASAPCRSEWRSTTAPPTPLPSGLPASPACGR